ncbi:MAG: hypothetical protein N2561_05305 [Bacteroidetes bacterium]|nr:hypothetical protein [Rhodothermia bacterium]MCS7154902.1 hypothetical protein [Bacteroidota bacterium]MCX7906939.1 hypothetical protein [Bacteroidota bacterium]MDW8137697.1 hypothetical protein [Bacteroidota bacterium]MDW8285349.1 hypothetical protein [Bacteroidota bacterium]
MPFWQLALFLVGAFLIGFATGFLFWRLFAAERLEQVRHLHWEIAKRDRAIRELQLRLKRLTALADLGEGEAEEGEWASAESQKPAA